MWLWLICVVIQHAAFSGQKTLPLRAAYSGNNRVVRISLKYDLQELKATVINRALRYYRIANPSAQIIG